MDDSIKDGKAATKTNDAELSRLVFGDKDAFTTTFGKMTGLRAAAEGILPQVDFVVSNGNNEKVFSADGSVKTQKTDRKVDPECSNGVKAPDGSEQRFDSRGLCKVIGDVHWDKANDKGNMEIEIGKSRQVKIELDNNFHLVSVKGPHTDYDAAKLQAAEQLKVPALKGTISDTAVAGMLLEKSVAKASDSPKQAREQIVRPHVVHEQAPHMPKLKHEALHLLPKERAAAPAGKALDVNLPPIY